MPELPTPPEFEIPEPPATDPQPVHTKFDIPAELYRDLKGKLDLAKSTFEAGRKGGREGMTDQRKHLFQSVVEETKNISPDMWQGNIRAVIEERYKEVPSIISKIMNYRSQMQQALDFHEELAKKKQQS